MGRKLSLEKEFRVGFIATLPPGSRSNLKRNLWQPYFPEVPTFSQIRKALRGLFLFSAPIELQMSSVQNNLYTSSGFLSESSYNAYGWLKQYLGVMISEKYSCGHASVFHGKQQFCLKSSSSWSFGFLLVFLGVRGVSKTFYVLQPY